MAVLIDGVGHIRDARVCLGGVAGRALGLPETERVLIRLPLAADIYNARVAQISERLGERLETSSNFHASGYHQSQPIVMLLRRATAVAINRVRGDHA